MKGADGEKEGVSHAHTFIPNTRERKISYRLICTNANVFYTQAQYMYKQFRDQIMA